jgi:transposase InsO family protein
VPATASRHALLVVPNLARGMQVSGLEQLWVADIAHGASRNEFVYLAVVIDVSAAAVVSWALGAHDR